MKKNEGRVALKPKLTKLAGHSGKSYAISQSAKDNIAKLVSLTQAGVLEAAAELLSATAFAAELLTWLCPLNPS